MLLTKSAEQSAKRLRKIIVMLTLLALSLARGVTPASAQEELDVPLPSDDTSILCTPRIQLRHSAQCTSDGPASQLAEYARKGVFPSDPLPADNVNNSLSYIPYNYLSVTRKGINVYPSVQSALNSSNPSRSLGRGFIYVSWIDRFEENGGIVYQIGPGEYIRGDNVSRISTPSFLGLTFTQTPDRPFGWIMRGGNSYIAPGFDQQQTSNTYYRFEIVHVYDAVTVGDNEWYMIAPGEWIDQRNIAMVTPDTARPKGVEEDRWISVNLFEQTMTAYENGELVFATAIASGLRGWWTQPGLFQVYVKLDKTNMSGSFEADRSDYYYLEDVPWVLYYDQARAIHGTYWHNNYGYQQSHGCVNLSPADAQWIFDWAEKGTYIHVWDPSNITPTDPAVYGYGGA